MKNHTLYPVEPILSNNEKMLCDNNMLRTIQKSDVRVIPYKDCLAKTIRLEAGSKPGVSVKTHCLIVGYVAKELLSRLPVWLRESLFPKGSELIAAAHDVGKISPAFQEKIHRDIGKSLGLVNPELDKVIGGHSSVSQAAVSSCSKYIPEILGRHHGKSPASVESPDAEIYGGSGWQKERMDLLSALKEGLNVDWPLVSSALHSDVLAGLTTVADWIGSGSLFHEVNQDSWKNCISEALDRAGFVAPKIRKGLTFKEVFGFSPRDIQTTLGKSINTRGAYVLEAPMGLGKNRGRSLCRISGVRKRGRYGYLFCSSHAINL